MIIKMFLSQVDSPSFLTEDTGLSSLHSMFIQKFRRNLMFYVYDDTA